jgi:hypothetical protein
VTVWVDSDSCPLRVREIVVRAAERREVAAVFVANRAVPLPKSKWVFRVVVAAVEGSADAYIVGQAGLGDLVITRDIPLAAEVCEKNITVINDRGDIFTRENIRERLSVRNFMKDLRDSGLYESPSGGYGDREVRLFSAVFDRELTRLHRAQKE